MAIGRHEHIGHEIDHEVEHVRPTSFGCSRTTSSRRAIGPSSASDHERCSQPTEHRRPVLSHGFKLREQRDAGSSAVKTWTENAAARLPDDPSGDPAG